MSLLHECFTITNQDHAEYQTSLLESIRLKLFSCKIGSKLSYFQFREERLPTKLFDIQDTDRATWQSLLRNAPIYRGTSLIRNRHPP